MSDKRTDNWATHFFPRRAKLPEIGLAVLMVVGAIALIPVASATAPTHTVTLPAGSQAVAAVYDSGNGDLYVEDQGNCVIYAISTATYTTTTITPSGCPGNGETSLAYDPFHNYVYVAGYLSATIYVIKDSTNTIVSSIAAPTGTAPYAVAYDTKNHDIYVSDSCFGTCVSDVTVLSGTTTVTTITLASNGANAIAYNPGNDRVYVYTAGSTSISVITPTTNAVSATTIAVTGMSPNGFGYDAGNGEMYAAEGTAGSSVYVISATTIALATTVTVGTSPYTVGYDPAAGGMVATNQGAGTVSIISSTTNAVLWTVTTGTSPTIPVYDPASGNMYISDEGANNVAVVAPQGGVTSDSDAVGSLTDAMAFDSTHNTVDATQYVGTHVYVLVTPKTLGVGTGPIAGAVSGFTGELYVANSVSNSVSIYSSSNALVTTLAVGTDPTAVSYDLASNRMAVANTGSGSLTVISTTNTIVTTIPLGGTSAPDALAYAVSSGLTYVALNGSGVVYAYSLVGAPTFIASITVGTNPSAMAYDVSNGYLYVVDYGSNSVSIINPLSNTVVTTLTYPGTTFNSIAVEPFGPGWVAVGGVPSTGLLINGLAPSPLYTFPGNPDSVTYLPWLSAFAFALRNTGLVETLSTVGALATLPPVGLFPTSIGYDPTTQNLYVANWGSASVTVFGMNLALVTTLVVGANPTAVVSDPANGETYVSVFAGGSEVDV